MLTELDKTRRVVKLTGDIMTARRGVGGRTEEHFGTFERMLRCDYRDFAKGENFPDEAGALSDLQGVFKRMTQMRLAPHVALRNICGVAGGFSSGKSSLLNALMGEAVLPTDITPTTSIPTYLSSSDDEELIIRVFNQNGGSIAIDASRLHELTNGFGKIHGSGRGIPLKPIVHRVSIRTPRLKQWRRVAFVDTPGYTNRDDDRYGDQDEQVALREVLTCRCLIWVLDCENGELPGGISSSCQEFVNGQSRPTGNEGSSQDQPPRKPPIYLVLNKADKKRVHGDRGEILKKVAERHQRDRR